MAADLTWNEEQARPDGQMWGRSDEKKADPGTAGELKADRGPVGEKAFDAGLIGEVFGLPDKDIRSFSPLTLAYIGDAVYEMVIRTILVRRGNRPVSRLHHDATRLVRASAQAQMLAALEPLLTGEESDICRRGRNAHSPTMAKNASMTDYRHATAFETLMGYLYLTGRTGRMLELIRLSLESVEG